MRDGRIDLADAGALFTAGHRDLAHDGRQLLHRRHHLIHGQARFIDEAPARIDFFHRVADQFLDFLRRASRALRQIAHFGRHHGKAPALLARASRLDGRVQGQDIRLESDAVNHADDVDDLARTFLDASHRAHHLLHHAATLGRHFRGGHGQFVGRMRVFRILLDGRGQLIHRTGRFLQRARLRFRARGQIGVAGGNIGRLAAHQGADAADLYQHGGDLFHEQIEGLGDLRQFVATFRVEAAGQVAVARGDRLHRIAHQAQAAQGARHQHAQYRRGQGQHQQGRQDRGAQHGGQCLRRFGAVEHGRQQPVAARHFTHMQDAVTLAEANGGAVAALFNIGQRLRAQARIELGQRFQGQLAVRMGDDLAAAIDEKAVAGRRRLDRGDVLHHGIHHHIGRQHARHAALAAQRLGKRHHQLARAGTDIRRRDDGAARFGRQLVPGPRRGIVVGGTLALLRKDGVLVGKADVRHVERARLLGRLQGRQRIGRRGALLERSDDSLLGTQPFGDGRRMAVRQLQHLRVERGQGAGARSEEIGDGHSQHGQHDDGNGDGDQPRLKGGQHGASNKKGEIGRDTPWSGNKILSSSNTDSQLPRNNN